MRVKQKIMLLMLVLLIGSMVSAQTIITAVDRTKGQSGSRDWIGAFDGETDPPIAILSDGPDDNAGDDGEYIFADRTYHYNQTSTGTFGHDQTLIGSDIVQTFNTDKGGSETDVAYTVTIGQYATVWIAVDDRHNPIQATVDSITSAFVPAGTFVDTGLDVHVFGDSDPPGRTLSVFSTELGPGDYVFGPKTGNNFYVIGAVDADETLNPAPTVDAGPTLIVDPGQDGQLAGTAEDKGSFDGTTSLPNIASIAWSQTDGPGTATFSDDSILDPTVSFSEAGVYTLTLTVSDGEKEASDSVIIKVLSSFDAIARWEFEIDDPNVLDSINNNDGVLVGDANFVDGWIGDKAIAFYGNGRVNITPDENIDPNFIADLRYVATVSAWIKVEAFSPDSTWDSAVAKGSGGWRLARNGRGNTISWHINASGGQTSVNGSTPVNDGMWHHLVGTYGPDFGRLYIDGILDAEVASTGVINEVPEPIAIGGRAGRTVPNDRDWTGGPIDDVQIFDFAMTAEQVRALSSMGALPPSVDAGPDDVVQLKPGQKYTLQGIVEDYGTPGATTVTWATDTELSVDEAIFTDASDPGTEVEFPSFGIYVLTLTAEDDLAISTDSVQIEVVSPTCADVIAEGLVLVGDITGPDSTEDTLVPDCRVDMLDLAELISDWMNCNDPEDILCDFPY